MQGKSGVILIPISLLAGYYTILLRQIWGFLAYCSGFLWANDTFLPFSSSFFSILHRRPHKYPSNPLKLAVRPFQNTPFLETLVTDGLVVTG